MKMLSEKRELESLRTIREGFREQIQTNYEPRAKNCGTCETQGACCLDAHFVNIRISRLEAAAIREVIERLPEETRSGIFDRVENTITNYGLGSGSKEKFACPLFEKGTGCLVHAAKPLPCIQH